MAGAFKGRGSPYADVESPEERERRRQAFIGGAADMGGATSYISEKLGYPGVSAYISGLKEQNPESAEAGDLYNPLSWMTGPLTTVAKGAEEWWQAKPDAPPPEAMSLDKFTQERRKPIPEIGEYKAQRVNEARMSKAYNDLMSGTDAKGEVKGKRQAARDRAAAENMLTQAIADAEEDYGSTRASIEAENAMIPGQYGEYIKGVDKELEGYYGRDFATRHPNMSSAMTVLGPAIAALIGGKTFRFVNKRIGTLTKEAEAASKGGKIADEAKALDKLEWWRRKGKYTGISNEMKTKLGPAFFGATAPIDMQMYKDLTDYKDIPREYQDSNGEWQRSRAQETAEDKLTNPLSYLAHNAPTGLLSGLVSSVMGAKFLGGKPGSIEADALLNPNAARFGEISRNRIAALDAEHAVAMKQIELERALQAAKNAPQPKPRQPRGNPNANGPNTPPPNGPSPNAGPSPGVGPNMSPGAGPVVTPPVPPAAPRLKQKDLLNYFEQGLKNLEAGKPFASKGSFMRGAPKEAKDRVMKGANSLGLDGANVSITDVDRARRMIANGNLKLGIGAAGVGYSAVLAKRLAELRGEDGEGM